MRLVCLGVGFLHRRACLLGGQTTNRIFNYAADIPPKDGVRVSYEALERAYLREYDLINLIRSGYIGTHKVESDALHPIISEVTKGNRALVLAWQKRIEREVDT